jgi:hypothetical protein
MKFTENFNVQEREKAQEAAAFLKCIENGAITKRVKG